MLIKRRLSFRLFSLPLLSFYMKRKRKFSPPFEVISWPICEVERLHSLLPAWMPPINAADGQWVCVSMSSGTSQTQVEILPLPLTDWCPTIANPWQELSAIYIYIYRWLLPLPIMLWKRSVILCSSPSGTGAAISIYSEQPSWSLSKRDEEPQTLPFIALDSFGCLSEGKKWGQEKQLKIQKWKKQIVSAMTIISYTINILTPKML